MELHVTASTVQPSSYRFHRSAATSAPVSHVTGFTCADQEARNLPDAPVTLWGLAHGGDAMAIASYAHPGTPGIPDYVYPLLESHFNTYFTCRDAFPSQHGHRNIGKSLVRIEHTKAHTQGYDSTSTHHSKVHIQMSAHVSHSPQTFC